MSRRGHRTLTQEQRNEAARRALMGIATVDEICEECDVAPQTVRSWMAHLDGAERLEYVDRFRAALSVLRWVNAKEFARIVDQLDGLIAEARRLDEQERERRASEYRAQEERRRAGAARPTLTVLKGGVT